MTRLIVLLSLLAAAPPSSGDSLVVMFWNLENFFDPHSGNGSEGWTSSRFYKKCDAVAKTILLVADRFGQLPDAIGFAEVENDFPVTQVIKSTSLNKTDYSYIHFDSPDHRGIDCALLFRRHSLRKLRASPIHILDSTGNVIPTRDILLSEFISRSGDTLAITVNHHPSQIGGKTYARNRAMDRLTFITDSLVSAGCGRVLSVGDFNEDRWHRDGPGTIKYNGAWEKIDGHFARGFSSVEEFVFDSPYLSTSDRTYGGTKPLRTFSGPRYLGGVSDHYPIIVVIRF